LFYLALFFQCSLLTKKGCWRTALETCKCLLRLDPRGDPLGAWLLSDYLALKSGEYRWLLECWQQQQQEQSNAGDYGSVRQLPGWWFSQSLAHLAGEQRAEALNSLTQAVLRFPRVALLLAERLQCSAVTDEILALLASGYGEYDINEDDNDEGGADYSLALLLDELYADRSLALWKEPPAAELFADCMRQFSSRGDDLKFLHRPCPLPDKRYYRHAYLTDILFANQQQQQQQFTKLLPASLIDGPASLTPWGQPQLTLIDPLPPSLSIISTSATSTSTKWSDSNQLQISQTPIDPYADYFRRRLLIKYPYRLIPWLSVELRERNKHRQEPLTLVAILEHLEIKQNELPQSLLSDEGAVTGAGPMERFANIAANWLQPWLSGLSAIAGGGGVGGSSGLDVTEIPGLCKFISGLIT
jgi:tetratricopeptide (TPR) repeat protein